MIDNFAENFFEDEVREGFLVEKKMKCAWAAQMEVLVEIDRICNKYGIQYSAGFGTLLGAVRHKGFVPWDDDIDIVMERGEYQRFMEVAPWELPADWLCLNAFSPESEEWLHVFSRITNTRIINFREEHLKKYHGCPYIVGVDIFPLDYLPDNREEEEVLYEIIKQLLRAIGFFQGKEMNPGLDMVLTQIEELCRVEIKRDGDVFNQIIRITDNLMRIYENDRTEKLALLSWGVEDEKRYQFKKEWYAEYERMPFENISIPVPKAYKEVLTELFGEDYMTPKKFVAGHDYPFYKVQDVEIEKMRKNEEKE